MTSLVSQNDGRITEPSDRLLLIWVISRIILIRGEKVILDVHLAELYGANLAAFLPQRLQGTKKR